MRKLIVFFNGNDPYLIEVGEDLDSLHLEYPDTTNINLQIMSFLYPGRDIIEECFFASDRQLNEREIIQAREMLY